MNDLVTLTLVRMVSRLFQLLLLFMFRSAMSCHVDNFDSTKLLVNGLIQRRECVFNWFTLELLHKCMLDICHLCGLRGIIY